MTRAGLVPTFCHLLSRSAVGRTPPRLPRFSRPAVPADRPNKNELTTRTVLSYSCTESLINGFLSMATPTDEMGGQHPTMSMSIPSVPHSDVGGWTSGMTCLIADGCSQCTTMEQASPLSRTESPCIDALIG